MGKCRQPLCGTSRWWVPMSSTAKWTKPSPFIQCPVIPILNKTVLFIPSFCSFSSIHKQNPQSQYLQCFKGFSMTIRVLFTKKKFLNPSGHFSTSSMPSEPSDFPIWFRHDFFWFSIAFSAFLPYTECNEITDFIWAGRKTQVHQGRGSSPPFFSKQYRGARYWRNSAFS